MVFDKRKLSILKYNNFSKIKKGSIKKTKQIFSYLWGFGVLG